MLSRISLSVWSKHVLTNLSCRRAHHVGFFDLAAGSIPIRAFKDDSFAHIVGLYLGVLFRCVNIRVPNIL